MKWDAQDAWPPSRSDSGGADPRAGKPKRLETRVSATGAVVSITNYTWLAYRRHAGKWVITESNDLRGNDQTTYPIIWVRQESEDSWTAGGNWGDSGYGINGNGSGKQTKTLYDNTDSVRGYGNVLAVQEYSHTDAWITLADWITLLADSSRKPIRETKTDYFPNTTAYIVNQPARVRVYAGNECKAETWYIYGAYYTGNTYTSNLNGTYKSPPLNTALLVKTEQALDACSDVEKIDTYDAKWAVTRMAYDPFSNQTILDQVGNASDGSQNLVINTTYDSVYQLFPVSQNLNGSSTYVETARYYGVNEISGHSGVAIWGAMQEHCGVNEVCTRQVYDQFGRRARRWEGVDKSNNWGLLDDNALVVWLYATFGGDQSANAITEWRNPRAEGYFVRKLYNGLGQLIQEQRPYQGWRIGGGQEILVDYLYDTFGQQTRASTPRLTPSYSSGDLRRPAVWTGGYTQTDYDARGAAFQTVAPNGEQQRYNYAGRAYAHFGVGRNGDTNKMLKWEEYDELGRPKAVHTYTLDNNRWVIDGRVALTHDILGNLTEVSHPNNIGATSIRYDLGGRKTKLIDPDLGTWHYAYDRQGNLLRQTDARKQTTCLYYDAFGRLRDQYFRNDSNATTLLDCPTNLTTYDLSYRYDQSQSDTNRSRGQVTQVVRRRGSAIIYQKDLRYNANGLLASETIVTLEGLSAQYTTSYGYDAYLRPNKTTYPDNEEVTLTYNGMGLPKKLTSNLTTSALVDNADYDAAGRSTLLNFPAGGNLWRRNSYAPFTQQDSNGGRQVTAEVGTGINGNYGNRLYLDYQYDSFGNLKQLRELFGGTGTLATFGFTYDTQNRLKSGFGQDYTYDDAGRLTNYEGATFTLNNNVPVHTVKNSGYAYDANGNVRTRGSYTLEWDAENHLSAVKNGSTLVESYLYDLDGLRIKRSSSAGATYYLNALAEVAINATPTATPTRTPTPTVTATPCNTSPSFMAVPGPTGTPCPQATATQRPTLPPTATPTRGSPTPTPGEPTATPRPTNTPRPTVVITPTPCDSSSIFAPIPVPTVGPDPCNSSVMVSDVEAAQVAAPIPGASGAVYLPLIQQGEAPPPVEASAIDDPLPLTKYYYFNGQRIAMRQADGTLLYLHGDHLGSTSLVTKADGTILSDQGYRAYGRYRRGGALPTDHRFTGQKLDATGLYYYNARYYDPEIGQFISPDTLVPDPTNLFDYNRYMYVRGQPMHMIDPTGHAGIVANCRCGGGWNEQIDGPRISASKHVQQVGMHLAANIVESLPYADTPNDVLVATTGCGYTCRAGYEEPAGVGGRIFAGVAVVLPVSYSWLRVGQGLLVGFRNYDNILSLGRTVGAKLDNHHWVPQTFHDLLKQRYTGISDDFLQFTESLEDGFHSWLHGKGGTLQDAYNDRIRDWLTKNQNATLQEFAKQVQDLREEYLELYQQYLLQQ